MMKVKHEVILGRTEMSVIRCLRVYVKRKEECAELGELLGWN